MRASIIIPTWQNSGLTVRCFDSLRRELGQDVNLIWVDNGSEEKEFNRVFETVAHDKNIVVVRNRSNLGFIKATNQGIRLAGNRDAIILLNNDTEVYEGFAGRLLKHMDALDIYCPVTTTINSFVLGLIKDYPVDDGVHYEEYNKTIHERYGGQHLVKPWITFFCAVIKREVLNKIGLLDEDFLMGGGDDLMYCDKARTAGFRIGMAIDVFVRHETRKTFDLLPNIGKDYWGKVSAILQKKNPRLKRTLGP